MDALVHGPPERAQDPAHEYADTGVSVDAAEHDSEVEPDLHLGGDLRHVFITIQC